MKRMQSVSAAMLLGALLAVPGTAAFAAMTAAAPVAPISAKVAVGDKTDLIPISNLVSMVGSWTAGDLAFLDKAGTIKTYDTKALYPAAEQSQIASAEAAKATQLGKFRDAIRADGALNAWFAANHIDVNRVVAVADPNGKPEVFLY